MNREEWNLESAMEVVMSPTVDSRLWAEAVEWLMLHGPAWAREAIENASMTATCNCLPDLKPSGMNRNGEVCYRIEDLARVLGVREEEIGEKISRLQFERDRQLIFDENDTSGVQ